MVNTETATARDIKPLQAADASALCPLSKEAGWNQVAGDWRLISVPITSRPPPTTTEVL